MDIFAYILGGATLALVIVVLFVVISARRTENNIDRQLAAMEKQSGQDAYNLRREVLQMFKTMGDSSTNTLSAATKMNSDSMEKLRLSVEQKLKDMSEANERRLDQIRKTVDEQLTDLLQKKLTGSFKQVSDQLEQVFKSMGEVKSLATGVGDLKRVLTNVKVRGTWGEMQLGSLIDSMLSPTQYVTNANVKDNRERVEFAIVLPGSGDDNILLPIDSKFPMENYISKENVLEGGDKEQAKIAMKAIAKSMVFEAKRIRDKYINPPTTTDFAIMYLPTEGLYADAISLGVSDICQREYHVTVAGPSTLTALLNSLQMGFRTLAIEKQSGEVMKLLDSTRKAFSNFTVAIDKTRKSLDAAQNNLEDASRKSRTIESQLKKVDKIDHQKAPQIAE